MYTPAKTREYEATVSRMYSGPMYDGVVRVGIEAVFPVPRSYSRRKAGECYGMPYTHKSDADNIAKSILDGMNGRAFRDDSMVADLHVTKRYAAPGEEAGVIVEVSGVIPDDMD